MFLRARAHPLPGTPKPAAGTALAAFGSLHAAATTAPWTLFTARTLSGGALRAIILPEARSTLCVTASIALKTRSALCIGSAPIRKTRLALCVGTRRILESRAALASSAPFAPHGPLETVLSIRRSISIPIARAQRPCRTIRPVAALRTIPFRPARPGPLSTLAIRGTGSTLSAFSALAPSATVLAPETIARLGSRPGRRIGTPHIAANRAHRRTRLARRRLRLAALAAQRCVAGGG